MSSELITLEELKDLKPIECPQRGGVNFPCVVCKACEIGEVALTFGDNILIENTVNSVLIHMSVDITENDSYEKYVLSHIKSSVSKIVPFIQKGDWEEGDISILVTDVQKQDKELIDNINKFIKEFPIRWRRLSIESNRIVKDWSERIAKKLALEFFNELSDQRM